MNTEELDTGTVTLTIIENPLEMERTRSSVSLPYEWEKSVYDVLPERVSAHPDDWVIINDGRELTIDESRTVLLQAGGEVICYPRIKDKVVKGAIGIVLILAGVISGTPWLTYAGATMFATAMVEGFVRTPRPRDGDTSSTYGFGGIRNDTRIGSPIPVVYGEHRVGGHYIELRVKPDIATDNDTLRALIAVSEGEVDSVSTSSSEVEINGQAASNYNGQPAISIQSNTGTNSQSAFTQDGFGDGSGTTYSVGTVISTSWLTYTGFGTNITAWELNLTFPTGLWYSNKKGDIKNTSVTFDIEYRLVGAGSWTSAGQTTITASKLQAVRRYFRKDGLTAGQYEVRIKRTSEESTASRRADQAQLSSVTEIVNDAYKYPNAALLAVSAVATNQISGGLPAITTIVKGRKVRVYTDPNTYTTVWTDNPAWVVLDMLTNTRYGMGLPYSDMYIQSFIDWAAYCNELVPDGQGGQDKRSTCNIVFDAEERLWDAVLKVCAIGYAMLIKSGNKIQVKIEKQDTPVQLFTMANIVRGSFKESFMSLQNRSNVFEVQYLNKDNNYLQDMVTWEDPAIYSSAEAVKKQTVTTYGITRTSHAIRFARFLANINRYITRTIQFEVGIDAIACEPGDVIRFQHDVPQWGFASRAAVGSGSSSVVLDTAMTVEASKTYQVLVRHSDDTIETKTVTNTPGTYTTLTISGTWTQTPADGDVVAFGETSILVKPFRIVAIERTEQMTARVTSVEYNASVYDDSDITAANVVNYSVLPNPNSPPPQVTDLALSQLDDDQRTVAVTFTPPNDYRYQTARIYKVVGDMNVPIGESREGAFYIHDTPPGTELTIIVISVSRTGSQANISQAPSATITVSAGRLPPDVTGLELVGQGNDTEFVGKDAKFQWRDRGRTSGFGLEGLGEETLGAGAGGIDPFFKNYRVEIYNTDGVTLRRREYVVDPLYTYSHEKNYEDAQRLEAGVVVRSFMIKVWQQDTFNQMSASPAILTVSNPSPGIVGNFTVTDVYGGSLAISWDKSAEIDITGYKLHMSTNSGFTPDASNLIYSGPDTYIIKNNLTPGTTYYFKVAAFDTFGESGLTYSGQVSATPSRVKTNFLDLEMRVPKIAGISIDANPSTNVVSWTAGVISYVNDAGSPASVTTSSGNATWTSGLLYIYWVKGATTISTTTNQATAYAADNVILGTYQGGTDLVVDVGRQVIHSSFIRTISLSAINANLGYVTAGTLEAVTMKSSASISYNNGTGWWIGIDASTPKLFIGNSVGNKLTWDGTTLTVVGSITIQGGSGYANLSDKPTSLSSINSGEGTKLSGIQAGATANSSDATLLNRSNHTGTQGASSLDTTVISGGKIITGLLTADNIQTGTLNASLVTVTNLSASNIITGTISLNRLPGLTVSDAATYGGAVTISATIWTDLVTISFTTSGGTVHVIARSWIYFNSSAGQLEFRLRKDETADLDNQTMYFSSTAGIGYGSFLNMFGVITGLSAGSYTFKLQSYGGSGNGRAAAGSKIMVIETIK
ncbi:MAG: fibronectin type III domain-containing protein [Nitrospirae bacterium]|nr:fibronectin type III domain-containing protein [Nitrospirota bacterium]